MSAPVKAAEWAIVRSMAIGRAPEGLANVIALEPEFAGPGAEPFTLMLGSPTATTRLTSLPIRRGTDSRSRPRPLRPHRLRRRTIDLLRRHRSRAPCRRSEHLGIGSARIFAQCPVGSGGEVRFHARRRDGHRPGSRSALFLQRLERDRRPLAMLGARVGIPTAGLGRKAASLIASAGVWISGGTWFPWTNSGERAEDRKLREGRPQDLWNPTVLPGVVASTTSTQVSNRHRFLMTNGYPMKRNAPVPSVSAGFGAGFDGHAQLPGQGGARRHPRTAPSRSPCPLSP